MDLHNILHTDSYMNARKNESTINNEQSRDTGNNGHKTQNEHKHNTET